MKTQVQLGAHSKAMLLNPPHAVAFYIASHVVVMLNHKIMFIANS